MHLLLVEDQQDFAEALAIRLTDAGYSVDVAHDGVAGEAKALSNTYDILLVDWMLPQQDGVTLIRNVREADVQVPILMLTALTDVEKRVEGLDAGADDYLTKPFAFDELFARLRALRRRTDRSGDQAMRLSVGPISIDRRSRKVFFDNEEFELRPKEYELLELMAQRAGNVVSRTVISEAIWGSLVVTDDTINTTISSLRRKLRDAQTNGEAASIETVRGVGYRLATS